MQKQNRRWEPEASGGSEKCVLGTEISKEPKARKSLVYSKNRKAEDLARAERASGRAVVLRMEI